MGVMLWCLGVLVTAQASEHFEYYNLQAVKLGGFEVEKKGIVVIELRVDIKGSNGGGSFKVEQGSNAA